MKTTEPETMVWFGGECKALDDKGKIGGHLLLWGSAEQTDATRFRDYFTPETDLGLDLSTKARFLYHHGLVPPVGNRSLGIGNLKADDVGVWVEGQLALRDEYERKIFDMVKAKKLGFSSGTASHLIRREPQPNGANKVVAWPLGLDASLTPAPGEPRTQAMALKSLLPPEVKGLYLGDRAEPAAMMAALDRLSSMLCCTIWNQVADEKATPADRHGAIAGAFDEFKTLGMKLYRSLLMGDDQDSGAVKSAAVAEDLRLFDQIGATLARTIGLEV